MKRTDELLADITDASSLSDLTLLARTAESEGSMAVVRGVLDALEYASTVRLDASRDLLDEAKAANRPIPADDARRIDAKTAEVDQISMLRSRLDRKHRRAMAEYEQRQRLPFHQMEPDHGESTRTDGPPLLRANQSVAAHVARTRSVETFRPGALGRILAAKVTGRAQLLDDQERRAMSEGSGGGGGSYLVNESIGAQVVDLLRNELVLTKAGMLTVPMETAEHSLIRVVSDGTPTWKAENAAASESAMEFGRLTLQPKTVIVLAKMSRELFDDALPQAGTAIEKALVAALAQEVQRAGFYGSGVNAEPRGLRYNSFVTRTVLGSGAGTQIANHDFILDAMQRCYAVNVAPTARINAPRLRTDLASLKEAVNLQPLRAPQLVADLPEYVTNSIGVANVIGGSTDCTDMFLGDFAQIVMGLRTGFNVQLSEQAADTTNSAFTSLQVWIRAFLRVDFAVLRQDAIQCVSGIRPPA